MECDKGLYYHPFNLIHTLEECQKGINTSGIIINDDIQMKQFSN